MVASAKMDLIRHVRCLPLYLLAAGCAELFDAKVSPSATQEDSQAAAGAAEGNQTASVAGNGNVAASGTTTVTATANGNAAQAANAATTDTSTVGGQTVAYAGPPINFPNNPNKWATWAALWSKASGQMASYDSAAQIAVIQQGIDAEAATANMDPRFVLAVVMQESGGNVYVGATNNGVHNPGLMQSHNGTNFNGTDASILQMIKDGVEGTASGDGLVQPWKKYGNYFVAARVYNSGQVDMNNLSNAMGATASYASDIANFVMGRK